MIRLSIRRPVAVTMVYASVALLGVAAVYNLPLEYLPDTTFPRLTINASWPGTSPETMEAFVTSPIEATIQHLDGVEKVSSNTSEGRSAIAVEFVRDADMDFVRLDLSERLATLEEELPPGVSRPLTVSQYVPPEMQQQVNQAFMRYTFTGPYMIEALSLHLEDFVQPELLDLDGIEEVQITGGRRRVLEIELDPDRIASLGLTPQAVESAIGALSIAEDVGAVRDGDLQWIVRIDSRPSSEADIRDLILPLPAGRTALTPIRLEEVARVSDTFEEPSAYKRINRGPAIEMVIHKERSANSVRLADAVQARLAELEPLSPPGASFELLFNQADDVRRELSDLRTRAGFAAVVIFVVLVGFLRSFRTAGVVFSTIIFSILIALNLVYFAGLSLNVMTLMGIALGFGLIVDNSIVVLENVYRKWQDGAAPEEAAEKGSKDVVLPIFAATSTTLIVFIPFLYFQGEVRIFYLPLAIVVGLTLIASIFVAFSFIPAVMARVLRKQRRRDTRAVASERPPAYIRFYSGLLAYTLRFPWTTVMVAVVCLVATWFVFDRNVPRGVLFGGGSGATRSTIRITITMPRGSDLGRIDELTQFFEERLATMPELERFEATVRDGGAPGSTSRTALSTIIISFPEELEFTAVPLVIEERLRAFSLSFTGADVRVYGQGPAFYGSAGASIPNYRITLYGYNYLELAQIAEDLGARLSRASRVQNMNTNAAGNGRDRLTEFVAVIDRGAAARQGLTVQAVMSLVNAQVAGTGRTLQIPIDGEPVWYQVKLEGYRQADVEDLQSAVVTTNTETRVPLGELIRVEEREVITEIIRENQQYQRVVAYEFRGPNALGDTIRNAAMRSTDLPAGYSMSADRTSFISREDARQINLVLLVSVGLIFMVTAGLFESVRQPLCVLLAVPMALIGVFLTFFFVGASFTREAYIGVIMMGGIVVNNAILLIDHVNRVRAETHLRMFDALVRATLERVRPILMTTATTVFGLLPLVLFMPAADARIWNALTYSLIGGLLSSTIFVLTTTPALYLLFERIGKREGTPEWAETRWEAARGGEKPPLIPGALPGVAGD